MQSCKDKCIQTQYVPDRSKSIWDIKNISYCSMCTVYFITENNRCECCGTLLRKNPHNKKSKERLRNAQS